MKKTTPLPHAYTLAEMMVATAVGAVLMALSLTGGILVQRSFLATDFHGTAQNDQLRLSDYLALELRQATSLAITRNGQQLDLTLPPEDAPLLQVHLDVPVLGPLLAGPTPTPRKIRYSIQGTDLYREEDGVRVCLAKNLTEFQVLKSGVLVSVNSAFQPHYADSNASRSATEFTRTRQTVLVRFAGLGNATGP